MGILFPAILHNKCFDEAASQNCVNSEIQILAYKPKFKIKIAISNVYAPLNIINFLYDGFEWEYIILNKMKKLLQVLQSNFIMPHNRFHANQKRFAFARNEISKPHNGIGASHCPMIAAHSTLILPHNEMKAAHNRIAATHYDHYFTHSIKTASHSRINASLSTIKNSHSRIILPHNEMNEAQNRMKYSHSPQNVQKSQFRSSIIEKCGKIVFFYFRGRN